MNNLPVRAPERRSNLENLSLAESESGLVDLGLGSVSGLETSGLGSVSELKTVGLRSVSGLTRGGAESVSGLEAPGLESVSGLETASLESKSGLTLGEGTVKGLIGRRRLSGGINGGIHPNIMEDEEMLNPD